MKTNKLPMEAREARNAYQREWRRKNKEKNKAIQARYWMKKAEKMKERTVDNEGLDN